MTHKNETDLPFSEPTSSPIQSLDDAILFEVVEPERRGDKVVSGRGVYIFPNLITTISLFSAFASILASFNGDFKLAIGLIFASGFLDGIDGRLARMLNAQSRFGEEFDSLADLLAFGAAPAFLVYSWTLSELGRFGMGVSFIFLAFALCRSVGVLSSCCFCLFLGFGLLLLLSLCVFWSSLLILQLRLTWKQLKQLA